MRAARMAAPSCAAAAVTSFGGLARFDLNRNERGLARLAFVVARFDVLPCVA